MQRNEKENKGERISGKRESFCDEKREGELFRGECGFDLSNTKLLHTLVNVYLVMLSLANKGKAISGEGVWNVEKRSEVCYNIKTVF